MSTAAIILSHRVRLPSSRSPSIPWPSICCPRCYARMARRSPPPVRPKAGENEESESDSTSEDEEVEMDLDVHADDDDDDGEESEWEGFVMDFGAEGKDDGSKKEDDAS